LVLAAHQIVLRSRGAAAPTPDPWGALAGSALLTLAVAAVAGTSENGSMAAFVLVVLVALASVRIGRAINARLRRDVPRWERIALAALLLAPFVLLLPLALIDMGLFLVVVLPIGFATLLATGWKVVGRALLIPGVAFGLLFFALFVKVLFPSVDAIHDADTHLGRAAAFDRMGRIFGVRVPVISGSMDRVAARALATRDPKLAEEMLVSANPGPARDLLIPSIEQIWGARAYASAGPLGMGLGRAVVGGRGVAEPVSYAENAYSVFVLAEHGAFGGFMVLLLYLMFTMAAAMASMRAGATTMASHRASRSLFIVATLLVVIPATYVALSNLGIVPITGQNMPFLGLNAWSDVALVAGAIGIIITGAMRRSEEVA
jgi:cell division protein FtsW (lipid II flippase)